MYKRRVSLQKLFSAFPDGRPGCGLLLLRALLSATLIAQTIAHITAARSFNVINVSVAVVAFLIAGCLLVGLFTPIITMIVGLGAISFVLLGLPLPAQYSFDTIYTLLDVIVLSAVILLLGPGAFSFDARMFGRREIRIPASHIQEQSKLVDTI